MNLSIFDEIKRSFSIELPYMERMDDYVDFIVGAIRPLSEDLSEPQYYLDTRWREFRDKDDFHNAVLHIFREGGEYLQVTDGNILKGSWKLLAKSNTMILEYGPNSELYDLVFLDSNFFILRKHGDQQRLKKSKYFVMAREGHAAKLEWRDVMESLFNEYRQNYRFKFFIALVFIVVLAVMLASVL